MAYYSHDTVTGPLSDAKGKEEVLVFEGKATENETVYDSIAAELVRKMRPTESEEDVRPLLPSLLFFQLNTDFA